MAKFKIKSGDTVMVTTGKDKGRSGKVLKVLRDRGRVVVEKINMVKKHVKSGPEGGGIIEKEAPIHISNVMLVCSRCGKPTRVGKRFLEDGTKVRYCKKCGEVID